MSKLNESHAGRGIDMAAVNAPDFDLLHEFALSRNVSALEVFYRRHSGWVYKTALMMSGSKEIAEDLTQSVFIQVIRYANRFRNREDAESAKGWLRGILVNEHKMQVRSYGRRRRNERAAWKNKRDGVMQHPRNNAESIPPTQNSALLDAINALPQKYQIVLKLRYCADNSVETTAAILSVTPSTIYKRTDKAVFLLRKVIKEKFAELELPAIIASLSAIGESISVPETLDSRMTDVFNQVSSQGVEALQEPAFSEVNNQMNKGHGLSSILIMVGMVAVGAVVGGVFSDSSEPIKNEPVSQTQPTQKQQEPIWSTDFNGDSIPPEISTVSGKVNYANDQGVSGSGCMFLEGDINEFMLQIPLDQLPVLILLKVKAVPSSGGDPLKIESDLEKGQRLSTHSFFYRWHEHNGLAIFHNAWNPVNFSLPTPWIDYKLYVTEKHIAEYQNGNLANLLVVSRKNNSFLRLGSIRRYLVDDLKIFKQEEIPIPEIQPHLNSIEELPQDKRVHSVNLFHLHSVNPKLPVRVEFHPATNTFHD